MIPGDNQVERIDSALACLSGAGRGMNIYPHGDNGVPHIAPGAFPFRATDPPQLQPKYGGKLHVHVFDLSQDEDRRQHEDVRSRAYCLARSGRAQILHIDRRYDETSRNWRIYFEWMELFTYDLVRREDYTIQRTRSAE